MKIRNIVLSLLLLGIAHTASAGTWYVATNGNDGADGTSWETAKQTIQAAIDIAESNDTVLVSNGVYATGGRVFHGSLFNRVVIDKPITVKSLNGPEVTAIRGASITRCVYVGTNAVLSGFMLSNGITKEIFSDTSPDGQGGGAWCEVSGTLTNCTISGNNGVFGGGAYGGTLNNCALFSNDAKAEGGGAYQSRLNDCTLTRNRAEWEGGGAYGCPLNNCTVSSNVAAGYGGGVRGNTVRNCELSGNQAQTAGGGAFGATLINCVLTGNSADVEGGGGADSSTLVNCVIYGNIGWYEYCSNYQNSTVSFSCTTPLPDGTGNITNDPQFVDAAGGDYRLSTNSPCIDRGVNIHVQGTTDLDGNPRIAYGTVDMGAYEMQVPCGYWAWAAGITNGLTNYTDSATGDGYPNLLKYAMGSDANASDELARMTGAFSNGLLQMHFNRNTNAMS